jgi:tetratricopeptide (TPR) repeat protein
MVLALWRSMKQTRPDLHHRNQDGDIDRPLDDYNEVIESNPDDPLAYLDRGAARLKVCCYDGAIADFNKALELNPCCTAAYTGRGSVYYDKAIHEHCDKALFQQAIADFTKAIEIDPKSALAYCNLGWTYEEIGEEQTAVACYLKALQIDPSLEAARDNLTLLGR